MGLGALKLPSRRFVPWACLAATLWTLGMVALGAALGEASFAISEASPYVAAMVLGAVALVTIRALTRPRPDAPSDA